MNWHEDGADDVARALLDAGVAVHAGLFTGSDGAGRFLASPFVRLVSRMLVEVTEPEVDAGLRAADALLAMLAGLDMPVLLHGEGATSWPVLARAAKSGLDTRIGLEDTLLLPDGSAAAGNGELVAKARILIEDGR